MILLLSAGGSLQTPKGQGMRLRRFGFEDKSGLGEESADELALLLDSLEPVLDDSGQLADSGGGEVASAVFIFAQTPRPC